MAANDKPAVANNATGVDKPETAKAEYGPADIQASVINPCAIHLIFLPSKAAFKSLIEGAQRHFDKLYLRAPVVLLWEHSRLFHYTNHEWHCGSALIHRSACF